MISLRQVSKVFRLYNNPTDRLMEWLLPVKRHQEFHALRDITLEIPKGRTIGLIGQNGAGKSTLLKLITGTLLPTSGAMEIRGRVAALLELGTGFHPEFTGRQNIYVNGQLLGMRREELAELEPEIIAFTELGPFIDQPVRTYSSGMVLRLGFSIAAAMNPELLIIDEALSVGDARFSQKCIRRIREFREEGTTILFVSHDPGAVTTLCDEAVLLERGAVRSRGLPKDILEEYKALLAEKGAGNVAMRITRAVETDSFSPRRHGNFHAVISKLELLNERGVPADVFHTDDLAILHVRIDFLTDVKEPTLGFLLKDRLGMEIYGTNTRLQGVMLGAYSSGEYAEIHVRIPLRLGYGDYSLTVAVHDDEHHLEACYEWTDNAAIFQIRDRGKPDWTGVTRLESEFEVTRGASEGAELSDCLRQRFEQLPDPLLVEELRPSPFLTGFGEPEERDGDLVRRLRSKARLIVHPRERCLFLKFLSTGDAVISVALPERKTLLDFSLEPGKTAVKIPLAAEEAGRLILITIEQQAPADSELFFAGLSSVFDQQEQVHWPITT